MKKITGLLVFILCFWATLQVQAQQFQLSTDDEGPWYKIVVKGTDVRVGLIMTVKEDTVMGQQVVFGGSVADVTSIEALHSQLWRVEAVTDTTYRLISRLTGTDMNMLHDASRTPPKNYLAVGDPNTEWFLLPATTPGLYNFKATTPLDETSPWLHQGNSGWSWRVIMETAQWGTGDNSQFQFVETDDSGGFITAETLDFGTLVEGEGELQGVLSFTAIGPSLDDIEIIVEDEANFQINPPANVAESAIAYTADAYFFGEEPGEYTTTATIRDKTGTYPDAVVTLRAKVKAFPVVFSPAVGDPNADAEGNVWYRIQSNKRSGHVLTDVGDEQPLEALLADAANENQLWKFVDLGDKKLQVINKSGREITFKDKVLDADSVQISPALYIAAEPAGNTYTIQLRSDDNWQMYWNEYEPATPNVNSAAYINKMSITSGDTRYTNYFYSKTGLDDGNSMAFILNSEDVSDLLPKYPEFSNEETEVWYYLQFERKASANLVWEEVAEPDLTYSSNVNQLVKKEAAEEGVEFQQWKLVGDKDNFQIVNKVTGAGLTLTIPVAQGIVQTLAPGVMSEGFFSINANNFTNGAFKLQIVNSLPGESASYVYLNDLYGTAICQYNANDAGNFINFIPVETGDAIDVVDTDNTVSDPVVSSVYYTIQGLQIGNVKPAVPGFYIEKNIHESGKVSAETIYVVK